MRIFSRFPYGIFLWHIILVTGDIYKKIPQTTYYGYFQKSNIFLGEPCYIYSWQKYYWCTKILNIIWNADKHFCSPFRNLTPNFAIARLPLLISLLHYLYWFCILVHGFFSLPLLSTIAICNSISCCSFL